MLGALLLVVVAALTSAPTAHGFFHAPPPASPPAPARTARQPLHQPWAGARGRRSVVPARGPNHSDESVIKHPKAGGGKGGGGGSGSKGKGGKEDEMALLSQALGEQDLLQQLLETMGRDSLSERTLDSVLRVYCTHVQPSFAAPWQRLQQMASTSSGFVIEGRRIITNAHSVEVRTYARTRVWVGVLVKIGWSEPEPHSIDSI